AIWPTGGQGSSLFHSANAAAVLQRLVQWLSARCWGGANTISSRDWVFPPGSNGLRRYHVLAAPGEPASAPSAVDKIMLPVYACAILPTALDEFEKCQKSGDADPPPPSCPNKP